MMYELGPSQNYWANKHRRMADVYSINGLLIIPVLLGVKGNLFLALGGWLILAAVYFIVPIPIFNRFKTAFHDFEKRFWLAQSTGMLAVLLLAILPNWRGVIALGWGTAALILIIPIIRGMKSSSLS